MRQEYELEFLQTILDSYSNLGVIRDFFLYTSGYENSNYYTETDLGKFVIKIFEGINIKPENIIFELEVVDFCFSSGLKTSHVLRNRIGKLETIVANKYAIVMDFIAGENMDQKILNDGLVVSVAEQAGKMDLLLKKFSEGSKTRQNYEWDLKNTLILENNLQYLPAGFDKGILVSIFNEFKKYKNEFDNLPQGLIHNDIVPHNWLVSAGTLRAIIDFSDLAFSPYVQNLAVSLHLTAFCCNWSPPQARLFLTTYLKFNPLSLKELGFLYNLIKARFLSFVLEFNRWNVDYGVDEQRTQTVADHYKFLKRFIEYGEDNFNKEVLD